MWVGKTFQELLTRHLPQVALDEGEYLSSCSCGWGLKHDATSTEAYSRWANHVSDCLWGALKTAGPFTGAELKNLAERVKFFTLESDWNILANAISANFDILPPQLDFAEGKKIYDQGWNDGLEQFKKTFELLASEKLR